MGDGTPIPSDSLAAPQFGFEIKIFDGTKELTTITKEGYTYHGNFGMNLKLLSGSLRTKSSEIVFFDSVAKGIVENIKGLTR